MTGRSFPPRTPPAPASSPGEWLYHTTSADALASIRTEGLRAGAYFAEDEDLVDYYAETIADEGGRPVRLRLALIDAPDASLAPDMPGLEEPIMTVVRARSGLRDEEAVWKAWEASSRDTAACLALIGSCKCIKPVPPVILQVQDDCDAWQPLVPSAPARRPRRSA